MDNEVATYGTRHITPEMGVASAILIILGLCLFLLGVRIPRLTVGIAGFLVFGLLTWVSLINNRPAGGYNNHDAVTMITVPAGLGVLGAAVCIAFVQSAIYLVGALGGLALALYILCWRADLVIVQPVGRACLVAALPIVMAVAAWLAQYYVLLFSTSLAGAYVFIAGVDVVAHTGYLAGAKVILDGKHMAPYILYPRVYALLSVTGAICLIGMVWQFVFIRENATTADVKNVDEEAAAGAVSEAALSPSPPPLSHIDSPPVVPS